MSVWEELDVINSKWPCQTAWRIHFKIYMEMHALWFALTGCSQCCSKYFSESSHSRWSISALLILSINLKHGKNSTTTSYRIVMYPVKLNQSGHWSVCFCCQQVLRRSASCCSDSLFPPCSRRLSELQHSVGPRARIRFWSWNWNGLLCRFL